MITNQSQKETAKKKRLPGEVPEGTNVGCILSPDVTDVMTYLQWTHSHDEQDTPPPENNICETCQFPVRTSDPKAVRCTCQDQPTEGEAIAPEEILSLPVKRLIASECANCEFCGGHVNKPCLQATECARHKQMGLVKNDIDKIINDCGFTWDGDRHLQWIKQQRRHIKMIRDRILGGKWTGSKEGEVYDEFYDVYEEF